MSQPSQLSAFQAAAVLNGAVAFGLSQPLYEWARQQSTSLRLEWTGALVVVAIAHLVPLVALWLIRRRLTMWRPLWDVALGGTLLASVGWQARAALFGVELIVADPVAVTLLVGAMAVATLCYWRVKRPTVLFATYAGVLATVLPMQFVWHQTWPEPGMVRDARRPDTVVIVILDELSLVRLLDADGKVDTTRFPAFAALARRGLWFPQAMANYAHTALSVPSMLSGQLFDGADAQTALRLFERAPLLAALGHQGYNVHYASAYLGCPTAVTGCINYADPPLALNLAGRLRLLASQAYFVYARRASDLYPWLPAHARRREAELFEAWPASTLAAPGQATLLHLLLPHDPYVMSADGAVVRGPNGAFQPGRDLAAVARQYDAQIRWTDSVLGRFLSQLDRHSAARTTVVVTADHGTCWTAACQGRHHVEAVEPSLPLVPMFVMGPGVSPGVSGADYQHVDFMATVLRAVGLAAGSLTEPHQGPPRGRTFFPRVSSERADVGLPARVAQPR